MYGCGICLHSEAKRVPEEAVSHSENNSHSQVDFYDYFSKVRLENLSGLNNPMVDVVLGFGLHMYYLHAEFSAEEAAAEIQEVKRVGT